MEKNIIDIPVSEESTEASIEEEKQLKEKIADCQTKEDLLDLLKGEESRKMKIGVFDGYDLFLKVNDFFSNLKNEKKLSDEGMQIFVVFPKELGVRAKIEELANEKFMEMAEE